MPRAVHERLDSFTYFSRGGGGLFENWCQFVWAVRTDVVGGLGGLVARCRKCGLHCPEVRGFPNNQSPRLSSNRSVIR